MLYLFTCDVTEKNNVKYVNKKKKVKKKKKKKKKEPDLSVARASDSRSNLQLPTHISVITYTLNIVDYDARPSLLKYDSYIHIHN